MMMKSNYYIYLKNITLKLVEAIFLFDYHIFNFVGFIAIFVLK